jgi:hypothetical protein
VLSARKPRASSVVCRNVEMSKESKCRRRVPGFLEVIEPSFGFPQSGNCHDPLHNTLSASSKVARRLAEPKSAPLGTSNGSYFYDACTNGAFWGDFLFLFNIIKVWCRIADELPRG